MNNVTTIPRLGDPNVISYFIEIDGERLPNQLKVVGLSTILEINRIPKASIVLQDGDPARQDFELSNRDWFIPGKAIKIILGNLGDEATVFQGFIVNHCIMVRDGSSRLEIECRHVAYKMTLRRVSRYFESLSDIEIAEEILESYGLEVASSLSTFEHKEVVQYDVTDWDFLMMRMDFNGLQTSFEGNKVVLEKPNFDQEPILRLVYGSNVLEFDGECEVRDQFEEVSVRSWDASNQEISEVNGDEPEIKINGNLSGRDLAAANGEASAIHRHSGNRPTEELQSWADARLLKDRLARTRGRIQIRGHHRVKVGQLIELKGFGDRFNGLVYVAGVRHDFFEGNWLTDLEFGLSHKWFAQMVSVQGPPAAGMLAGVTGLQIGVVTQIEEDPDGAHRIKVKLPLVDNEASGVWARVATLDAGPNRGTFFRPEVEDEVLVGFINEDPRDAMVLGMLHSKNRAAPFTATKENNQKGFVTREGLRVVFDDKEKTITLETSGNNQIRISDQDKGISFSDEHGNQILMNEEGITLKSNRNINMESNQNIRQKAKIEWEVQSQRMGLKANLQMRLNCLLGIFLN